MWMALSGAIHVPAYADDAAEVRSLLVATWDKPGAKLDANPIVVEGGHALASWTQGGRGGRALLRKENGKWKVVLCSGDPLRNAAVLITAGVPAQAAATLAEKLQVAETQTDPARVKLFSTFEGVVRMDLDGHR